MSETHYPNSKWIKESGFGIWFLGTKTWKKHVLNRALDDLQTLLHRPIYQPASILDIGYGHGLSLLALERVFQPRSLIGLDIDPDAARLSRPQRSNVECPLHILRANANAIPLSDNSVDMIFCHQTFHHLVDQEHTIREFMRVLKPGGTLLFAESCRRYIHSWMIRLLFRHPMDVQKTDKEYIDLITSAGFQLNGDSISRPYLWWSRPDLGLLEHLRLENPADAHEETMINLVAYAPTENNTERQHD